MMVEIGGGAWWRGLAAEHRARVCWRGFMGFGGESWRLRWTDGLALVFAA